MCLVAIAWRAHPRYPVIIAGNRDEFHERPSAPARWWPDTPEVFGGRDLVAGGSWLAMNRNGRLAVVVNNPQRPPGPTTTASRGLLVGDYVSGDKPGGRFLDALQVNAPRYAGFFLVAGTPVQLRALASPSGNHRSRWTLRPGVSVISNGPLDSPSPKVRYLEQSLRALLSAGEPDTGEIFSLLARRDPVGEVTGDTPLAGRVPFMVGEAYGTRASTVIRISNDGQCDFEERNFGPGGLPGDTVQESFNLRTQ